MDCGSLSTGSSSGGGMSGEILHPPNSKLGENQKSAGIKVGGDIEIRSGDKKDPEGGFSEVLSKKEQRASRFGPRDPSPGTSGAGVKTGPDSSTPGEFKAIISDEVLAQRMDAMAVRGITPGTKVGPKVVTSSVRNAWTATSVAGKPRENKEEIQLGSSVKLVNFSGNLHAWALVMGVDPRKEASVKNRDLIFVANKVGLIFPTIIAKENIFLDFGGQEGIFMRIRGNLPTPQFLSVEGLPQRSIGGVDFVMDYMVNFITEEEYQIFQQPHVALSYGRGVVGSSPEAFSKVNIYETWVRECCSKSFVIMARKASKIKEKDAAHLKDGGGSYRSSNLLMVIAPSDCVVDLSLLLGINSTQPAVRIINGLPFEIWGNLGQLEQHMPVNAALTEGSSNHNYWEIKGMKEGSGCSEPDLVKFLLQGGVTPEDLIIMFYGKHAWYFLTRGEVKWDEKIKYLIWSTEEEKYINLQVKKIKCFESEKHWTRFNDVCYGAGWRPQSPSGNSFNFSKQRWNSPVNRDPSTRIEVSTGLGSELKNRGWVQSGIQRGASPTYSQRLQNTVPETGTRDRSGQVGLPHIPTISTPTINSTSTITSLTEVEGASGGSKRGREEDWGPSQAKELAELQAKYGKLEERVQVNEYKTDVVFMHLSSLAGCLAQAFPTSQGYRGLDPATIVETLGKLGNNTGHRIENLLGNGTNNSTTNPPKHGRELLESPIEADQSTVIAMDVSTGRPSDQSKDEALKRIGEANYEFAELIFAERQALNALNAGKLNTEFLLPDTLVFIVPRPITAEGIYPTVRVDFSIGWHEDGSGGKRLTWPEMETEFIRTGTSYKGWEHHWIPEEEQASSHDGELQAKEMDQASEEGSPMENEEGKVDSTGLGKEEDMDTDNMSTNTEEVEGHQEWPSSGTPTTASTGGYAIEVPELMSRPLFDGDDCSLWRNQIEGGVIFARPSTVFLMDHENNYQKLVGLELAGIGMFKKDQRIASYVGSVHTDGEGHVGKVKKEGSDRGQYLVELHKGMVLDCYEDRKCGASLANSPRNLYDGNHKKLEANCKLVIQGSEAYLLAKKNLDFRGTGGSFLVSYSRAFSLPKPSKTTESVGTRTRGREGKSSGIPTAKGGVPEGGIQGAHGDSDSHQEPRPTGGVEDLSSQDSRMDNTTSTGEMRKAAQGSNTKDITVSDGLNFQDTVLRFSNFKVVIGAIRKRSCDKGTNWILDKACLRVYTSSLLKQAGLELWNGFCGFIAVWSLIEVQGKRSVNPESCNEQWTSAVAFALSEKQSEAEERIRGMNGGDNEPVDLDEFRAYMKEVIPAIKSCGGKGIGHSYWPASKFLSPFVPPETRFWDGSKEPAQLHILGKEIWKFSYNNLVTNIRKSGRGILCKDLHFTRQSSHTFREKDLKELHDHLIRMEAEMELDPTSYSSYSSSSSSLSSSSSSSLIPTYTKGDPVRSRQEDSAEPSEPNPLLAEPVLPLVEASLGNPFVDKKTGAEYSSNTNGDGPWEEARRIDRKLGKEYSSDITGDGPPSMNDVAVGMIVKVRLDTFSWISDYNNIEVGNYFIKGVIKRLFLTKQKIEVNFPAIGKIYTRPISWMRFNLNEVGSLIELSEDIYSATQKAPPIKTPLSRSNTPLVERTLEISVAEKQFLENVSFRSVGKQGDLGVGSLNINGLDWKLKLPMVSGIMKQQGLGFFALLDTRLNNQVHGLVRAMWRSLMPGGDAFFTRDEGAGRKVGGIVILITEFWGSVTDRSHIWQDSSKGANCLLELSLFPKNDKISKITILSVYWPNKRIGDDENEHQNQLSARLGDWLVGERPDMSVDEYLLEQIAGRKKKKSDLFVCIGDFNAHRQSPRMDIVKGDLFSCLDNLHNIKELITFCGVSNTWIDFILSSDPGTGSGALEATSNCSILSDHLPVWSFFNSNTKKRSKIMLIKKVGKRPLRMKITAERETFQRKISAAMDKLGDHRNREWITQLTIQTVKAFYVRKAKWEKPTWTPGLSAMSLWHNLLRLVNGGQIAGPEIQRLKDETEGKILKLKDGDNLLTEIQFIDWKVKDWMNPAEGEVREDMERARNEMRGKRLQNIREDIKLNQLNREQDTAKLYKSLGVARQAVNLDKVQANGEIITDPKECQATLNSTFKDWFDSDRPLERDLFDKVQTREGFQQFLANPLIPGHLSDLIHEAIISKTICEECKRDMEEVGNFTLKEFMEVIKKSSTKSAGGPSGMTYNMLRHLPSDLQEKVFDNVKMMWEEDWIPKSFKSKMLYPIPKTANSVADITKVRPIMLIEIIRKILSKLLSKRLRAVIIKWKLLEGNQSGFLEGRDTGDAIFEFQNGKQQADIWQTLFIATTWDIKIAFDSVERELLELGVRRIGGTVKLARFLAYIDDGDKIQVISPHLDAHPMSFSSKRGCGQGDSASPLLWILLMDIILTALRLGVVPDTFTVDEQGMASPIKDSAFADDLLTGAGSIETVNRKSEVLCAALATFYLDLAVPKIRGGAINSNGPVTVRIYDREWQPMDIEFQESSSFKYLGAHHGKPAGVLLKEAKGIIQEAIQRLNGKSGSARIKNLYIQGALLPKLLYPFAFHDLSLQSLKKLDQPISTFLRRLAHVPCHFPTDVLYAPKAKGGLGFKRLSDQVQIRKLEIIQRQLRKGGDSRKAVIAFLLDSSSAMKGDIPGTTLEVNPRRTSWLTSLIEWLADSNLEYCSYQEMEPLEKLLPMDMRSHIINRYSDIATLGADGDWTILKHLVAPQMRQLLPSSIKGNLRWATGQFWKINDIDFVEVIGRTDKGLLGRNWQRTSTRSKNLVRMDIEHYPFGEWSERALVDKCKGSGTIVAMLWGQASIHHRTLTEEALPVLDKNSFMASDGSLELSRTGAWPWNTIRKWGVGVVQFSATEGLLNSWSFSLPESEFDGGSFGAESCGLFMARTLSGGSVPTYSDSQAALATTKAKKSTFGHLFDQPRRYTENWVKAHSDTRGGPNSEFELANIEADKAAAIPFKIDMSKEILNHLQKSHSWFLRELGSLTPLRVSVSDFVCSTRFNKYLEKLNIKRAADTTPFTPLCWSSGKIQARVKAKDTLPQRGAKLNLMLATADRDRCARVGESSIGSLICECKCLNCMETWTWSCQGKDMIAKRAETWELVSKLVGKPSAIYDTLYKIHHSPQAVQLYRGGVSEDLERQINLDLVNIDLKVGCTMLRDLGLLYQKAGLEMGSTRKIADKRLVKPLREAKNFSYGTHRSSEIASKYLAAITSKKIDTFYPKVQSARSTPFSRRTRNPTRQGYSKSIVGHFPTLPLSKKDKIPIIIPLHGHKQKIMIQSKISWGPKKALSVETLDRDGEILCEGGRYFNARDNAPNKIVRDWGKVLGNIYKWEAHTKYPS